MESLLRKYLTALPGSYASGLVRQADFAVPDNVPL